MRRAHDSLTLDLFEVPVARDPKPGALAVGLPLRHLLSDLLKASPLSRFDVAARMSELTGQEITKHQLDAWTAESRDGWRFPLEYLPAFEVAVQTHDITAWVADLRGCKVLVGKEALDAEIGRLERARDEASKRIKQLKHTMGEME
ncbi:hypothetical protein [Zoogloea sp.]|uniref:hypothetical protein n=1 Tax=Zoogloea sp. TaxID=49181 RepID=UPI0035ADF2F0